MPFPIEVDADTVKSTSTSFTASAESSSSVKLKWKITVTPDLRYTLTLDSSFEVPGTDPCNKPGAVFRGTLTKQG